MVIVLSEFNNWCNSCLKTLEELFSFIVFFIQGEKMNRIIILLFSAFVIVAIVYSGNGRPPLSRSISKIFFKNAGDGFVAVDVELILKEDEDDSLGEASSSDDTKKSADGWEEQLLTVPRSPTNYRFNSPSEYYEILEAISPKPFSISITETTGTEPTSSK